MDYKFIDVAWVVTTVGGEEQYLLLQIPSISTLKENDKKSNISLWDEKADYFGNYAIPTIEEDKFLKLLKDEKILNKMTP